MEKSVRFDKVVVVVEDWKREMLLKYLGFDLERMVSSFITYHFGAEPDLGVKIVIFFSHCI